MRIVWWRPANPSCAACRKLPGNAHCRRHPLVRRPTRSSRMETRAISAPTAIGASLARPTACKSQPRVAESNDIAAIAPARSSKETVMFHERTRCLSRGMCCSCALALLLITGAVSSSAATSTAPKEYSEFFGKWAQMCQTCHGAPPTLPHSQSASKIVPVGAAARNGAELRQIMAKTGMGVSMREVVAVFRSHRGQAGEHPALPDSRA